MKHLRELASREQLDALYRSRQDPWEARSIPEKQVRYDELERFLPAGPFRRALEVACGEGDFSARLMRRAGEVAASDISQAVVERAMARYPAVDFFQSDVRALPAERLRQFDLVVWLDAIYWLSREESDQVLARLTEAGRDRSLALLLSSRIVPSHRSDLSYWDRHDFQTPREFLEHVWRAFPAAQGVPVQLNLNLPSPGSLSGKQRAVRLGLRGLIRLAGYRRTLRLVQRASTLPFLAPVVDPFVVHMAAVVDPGQLPYPRSVEDVTDRFLNRPLAGRIVQRLRRTSLTPNQLTAVSCALGLMAAGILALGSRLTLGLGALLLQLSIVVDCADGQLARAKGLTSQWGEVFDHTSDDLTFLLVSVALGVTVWGGELGLPTKSLLVAGGFVAALLLTASQYFYNEEYRTVVARGDAGGVRDDWQRILSACQAQGRGVRGSLARGLLRYYAFRLRLMDRGLTWLNPWRARLIGAGPVDVTGRRGYWEQQAFPLWLWRLAGMSSVALLLVLACLLGLPLAFAWLLACLGLPFFGWVLWLQRRADRRTLSAWGK